MSEPSTPASRRQFLKTSGVVGAAATLTAASATQVHAGVDDTINIALVGCGGRGTGAAGDALSVPGGNTKLVAMADVFNDRLRRSYRNLSRRYSDQMDVPDDRRFTGFDSYKHAIDSLGPNDVVIFATPPAFRWVHFTYAIDKGVNVFMEKPVTVDGPTTRRMIELAKRADEKNMKVGVGLMIRHCAGRQELKRRIDDGEIGELQCLRAYRLGPARGYERKPARLTELEYQIRNFHGYLWASGGTFSDYNIHQVDECSWMKGSWPVSASGLGGRHFRGDYVDQNFDTYSVEYTFDDGTKFFFGGRHIDGCHDEFASYVHGTKGTGIVSTSSHYPGKVKTFGDQKMSRENQIWAVPQPEPNPYQLEWNDLVDAIRNDKPYNEVERGAIASLVTSMGRVSAHSGQVVTFDDMMNHDHELAPGVADFTIDGPAPIMGDENGRYPVPMPGVYGLREYA